MGDITETKDICAVLGLPPNPDLQKLYETMVLAEQARIDAGSAFAAAVKEARVAMTPVARLVYADRAICSGCEAKMAYDQSVDNRAWNCSLVLLGTQDKAIAHTGPLSFAFYDIKPESATVAAEPAVIVDTGP